MSPKRMIRSAAMRLFPRRLSVLAPAGLVALAALTACSAPPPRTPLEDQTRRVAPLPACVMALPARRAVPAGTLRHLKEEEIVPLVFPAFDEDKRLLAKDSIACTGRNVLGDSILAGGSPTRGGWPLAEQEGDALYGSG